MSEGSSPLAGKELMESLLVQCMHAPEADRAAMLDAACQQHPEFARDLRLCWEQIGRMHPPVGAPAQIAGHRILRRLGGGGMGVVYLAEQAGLGRMVAIKLIRSDLLDSAEMRVRFRREVVAASRLEHPGLCPVFEVGEADGVPFMVMPHLEGETLTARLAVLEAREGQHPATLSPERSGLIAKMGMVARAVHHAHEHGLVHRDIKPGNIMLLADGRPMLLDFGLARDTSGTEATLTHTGDRVGTPAYMAPEQLRGDVRAIDRRTDVYALGIVLYEVALLQRPFADSDLLAVREEVQAGLRPTRLRGRVPYDLASIILKAADPEPGRRYPTAAELADDLARFLCLEPVTARRMGVAGRSARWVRRHPVVSGLLTALAAALGIAAVALVFARTALEESRSNERRHHGMLMQSNSRAAERTDGVLAVEQALAADAVDSTPSSVVQINRALQARRELRRWQVDGWVQWVGFSPDRRCLHAVTRRGAMYTFEVDSGLPIESVPEVGVSVYQVALAPDGSFLVAGAEEKQALLWRFGDELVRLDKVHNSNVWDVAIGADSKWIHTIADGSVVSRWSAAGELDGQPTWQRVTQGRGRAIATCGDAVVFGGSKQLVIVRNDGTPPTRRPLPDGGVTRLRCAPAAGRILAVDLGTNGMFDLDGDTRPLPGVQSKATCGDMSADGALAAFAFGSNLRVFDLREAGHGVAGVDRAPYRDFQIGNGPYSPVLFSPDGSKLFAFGGDYAVHVFSADGAELMRLYGFTKEVTAVDFDPEHDVLATGDGSGSIRLWDTRTLRTSPPSWLLPGVRITGFTTGSGDQIIARCKGGRLAVLGPAGMPPRWIPGHPDHVMDDARLDRDTGRLASGGRDGIVRVWHVATQKELWATKPHPRFPFDADVVGVDFLPGDRLLTVIGRSRRVVECQIRRIGKDDTEPETMWEDKSAFRFNHGAATPDGRYVVLAGFEGGIRIVPIEWKDGAPGFGEKIAIPLGDPVLHIDIAPDGRRFVAACADNEARVYDMTGKLLAGCKGHTKRVEMARFSQRGDYIVTASPDGTARVFLAATGGEARWVLDVGAPTPVVDAQFGADETVVYTLSTDGAIQGWWLDRARAVAEAR